MTDRAAGGERWRRISEIFETALKEPDDRLDAFLAEACVGDRALEAEVRSLLESHGEAAGFLEEGALMLAVPELASRVAEPVAGALFGAWRVIRLIGEGGMGAVYLAERGDGQFRQQAALKLIRRGLATEEMIRRFRRERQILASLDHPGIARLLDGGTTADGLPWLVMEYVEGRPLYEWCSVESRALSERLRLFLSVCAAVQAAHVRLVLHRDIKPGNILITRDGQPRLMDFGVAKIFSEEAALEQSDLRTVSLPLTPEYASPEQLRGEEITIVSDIYSLGVVLYELTTGTRPYPTRAEGAPDMIRVILEHDPPRPSTALSQPAKAAVADEAAAGVTTGALAGRRPATLPTPPSGSRDVLRRRLSGDLDNIVLKAMSKEPQRRYASVEHLADDIRRFLEGRPVAARPATWSYRAGKFVRRNRLSVAAGALALLALVGGLVATTWQATIARRERDIAERRARDVQFLANALLFDVHDSLAALPGTTPIREMVVTKATEFLDRVAADAATDSATRFGLGDAYARLGLLQGQVWAANVGKADEAYRSFQKCREIREALLREYPDRPRSLYGVLQISTRIGLFDLEHARQEEGLAMLERALACSRRLIELYPDSLFYRNDLPKRLSNVGYALISAGRPEEGVAVVGEAQRVCEENARREPNVPDHLRFLAHCRSTQVEGLLQIPGMADSAIAVTRRVIAFYEEIARENPEDGDAKRHVAAGYYDLARTYGLGSDALDSAIANAHRAGAMVREIADADPGNQELLVAVAFQETGEGLFRAKAGQTVEAEGMLRRAVGKLEAWERDDSTDARFPENLAEAYFGLGLVEMSRARIEPERLARPRWQEARTRLLRARQYFDRAAGQSSYGDLTAEEGERIARSLAACDSALGAPPAPGTERASGPR